MPDPHPHGHAAPLPAHIAAKIVPHGRLVALRAQARAAGKRLVQCHGCFDIVHPGHIRHLRQARALGDLLLVSITGDTEISKEAGRPLIPEELRAENLAALDCVDLVYIERRATAEALLCEVKPDVYVKGKEYETNSDPRFRAEREAVERGGGRVVFSSGDVVFSSTALIAALENSADPFHARLAQLSRRGELEGRALFSLLAEMRGKRVVIVGETILDTYLICDRPDVAGESPVLTLRPLEARHYDGGAAVIARHIAAMGGRPVLVTPLPAGAESAALIRRLAAEGVEVRSLPVSAQTPEKQRFLVGAQKVMKLDLVEPLVLDVAQQQQMIGMIADACAGGADAAIVADFGLGLFTAATLGHACAALRPRVGVLAGDVSGKRSNLRAMRAMDLLCPSEIEVREALRLHGEGLPLVTWQLLEETRSKAALITLGADGLIAFAKLPEDGAETAEWRTRLSSEHIPALCPLAIDPLGCGDSMLAAATMTLAAGGSLLAAGFLGAAAAAAQVQRLGNNAISATDLRQAITRVQSAHLTYAPQPRPQIARAS